MARCCYCIKKIGKGQDFVLEGQYPGLAIKLGFAPLWSGPEWFGFVYHRKCFLKMLSSETQPEKDVREYCSKCGKEIPKGSKLCLYCISPRSTRVSRPKHARVH